MSESRTSVACVLTGSLCALALACRTEASGVPIGGYLPMLGIALTDEYKDDFTFFAEPSPQPSGMMLGNGGAHYDVAILDTGAAVSVLTAQAHIDFNMNGPYAGEPPDGHFEGTETIPIGGATGTLLADINDPLGLYAGGLQGRTSTSPLAINHAVLEGQTNTSMITLPPESDLPNVVGLTFASQYATYIRNDLPQIFQLDGHTVRTPHIEFLPLGSGGQGIIRRAPITLNPGASFQQPPFWFFNEEFDIDHPNENPSQPTVIQGGLFLTVTAQNEGQTLSNSQFLFDTGADVTVVSELNAVQLGFDPVLDEPEFTVAVVGSGGTNLVVPGFFADQLTVLAVGGSLTLTNVPIVVLDVPDPASPGNVVPGIIGTNIIAGRNAVIDPKPTQGGGVGPSLYIGDPITTQKNWSTAAASGVFGTGGNWSGGTVPGTVGIANVRHVAGGNQTAVVSTSTTVWELNVSGTVSQTMTVDVQTGVTLTTFSGINIEHGGVVRLQNGTLDTQFVEILGGGALRGAGTIATGSGPIPGQVENRTGTVSPGIGVGQLEIIGRFANGDDGILAFELGGIAAGTQYDQLIVNGGVALDGTLDVSLVNLGGGTFAPSIGDDFTLITATEGLSGTFETLQLPAGYQWDLDYNESDVVLSVIGIGLAGDFNQDGVVNAADYVWLRKFGTPTDEATWRTHFAESQSGASPSAGVPEPHSLVFALAAACGLALLGQPRPRRLTPAAPSATSTTH